MARLSGNPHQVLTFQGKSCSRYTSITMTKVQIIVLECGKEESVKITYERAYDKGLLHEITGARYKGVTMKLDLWDDMVFILGVNYKDYMK